MKHDVVTDGTKAEGYIDCQRAAFAFPVGAYEEKLYAIVSPIGNPLKQLR
jgi:hypothetical protein